MVRTNRHLHYLWKEHGLVIVISFIILISAVIFRQPLYGIFGEQNYLAIHFLMESLILTIALMITTQSWTIFPHNLSKYRLWIGSIFCSVALLEMAHMLTYKGMPHFFGDSSAYKATWFFIVSRLTEVFGILSVVALKDKVVTYKSRMIAYSLAFIYSLFWIIVIFYPKQLLPHLVIDGIGTTSLKDNLQYVAMGAEFLIIILLLFRIRSKEIFNTMLIVASIYMICADYLFTTYKSVYDINNFVGHWFQLAGFYFLQRAVYHSAIEEPFHKQKEVEDLLIQNERFLQAITSNMGEGLVVMDPTEKVTYINREAERLLQWSARDILGKNFYELVLRKNKAANRGSDLFKDGEEMLLKKSGELFPASVVETPFFEKEQLAGSIMVFRDITQQKKDQELIQYMAFYDELTTLPKARFLHDKWSELVQRDPNQKRAILILDIDRFKKINEALGHSFGDVILWATAERLKSYLSPELILARLTGDEFALILPIFNQEDDVTVVVEQIHTALREPLQAQNQFVNVTMCIGAAVYPDHGRTTEELLQHANMALMEAHAQNQSFGFYHPSMDGKALDHLVLENDLYHALENNELYLVYQPQINLDNGEITGVEALLRWRHPKYGIVSPAKFIPIAEETGLIVPIGEWVLRTACRQVKQWHDQNLPPIAVGVNLSVRQFYQQNLVDKVRQILAETQLPPQYLELEITESMMMNIDHTLKMLQALKELGVHIAIDDFGTGYSSLSYLKYLKVDRIKIDQSFVRDLLLHENETTIVSMIISMAHHLHFNVIAEGVETEKQKEILHQEKCQQVQGYLFSPPLPFDQLVDQFGLKAQESSVTGEGIE
ncbi:EAL domain-containing protein [Neobacillus sp. YIM B02564]|uniref:EAL domain-containing protein n=1 Tax=Neobacillus paridis TaxID=2803862 RepID=A0ABS1TTL1_9BACI|nr:EAL domain-containing protein [Neobacillus paridis]